MRLALERDDVRISSQPGTSDVLVVAFAGVGHALGGLQTEEFRKILSRIDQASACHLIWVIDKRRVWYNEGVAEAVAAWVNTYIAEAGINAVVTLGNSLGGFGAIVFARRLVNCVQAIAFCPQSSVKSDLVPFETRWPEWRAAISAWDIIDAITEFEGHISYDVFFGADDEIDMQHAARFRQAEGSNIHFHIIASCGHDVARYLKETGQLEPILQGLIPSPERE